MSFDDFDVFLVILYYIFKTRVSLLFIYLFIYFWHSYPSCHRWFCCTHFLNRHSYCLTSPITASRSGWCATKHGDVLFIGVTLLQVWHNDVVWVFLLKDVIVVIDVIVNRCTSDYILDVKYILSEKIWFFHSKNILCNLSGWCLGNDPPHNSGSTLCIHFKL